MREHVSFVTEDGVTIVGDFLPAGNGRAVLLLHMMPATKESWGPFAEALARRGIASLAIDFRGHGGSVASARGALDYRAFTDAEQQAKALDVAAAMRWLVARGLDAKRVAVCGASIGANLAIAWTATHPETPAVLALSPGLVYRGVTTGEEIESVDPRKLFLVASAEDKYSFESMRTLAALAPGAMARELDGAGHGTTMFERDPALMDEAVDWLDDAIPRPVASAGGSG
ncbi:MAG TPA: alpha/beta fold hydrolase [Patescibacteria group bacterium]|nr:alpha/beta fold hydrolase [Patescibacteria group bacterium]